MASSWLQSPVETSSRPGRYRWVVVTLVFIVYTAAYCDRAAIGITLPSIKAEFGLTNTQAGVLISAFAFIYAGFQVPGALLISRFGVRRILPLFLILTSLVTLGTGLSSGLVALFGLRILLGLAESPLGVAAVTTINNWFPKQEKGTATGILYAATKFAPLIVPPLGALILVSLGWRWVFLTLAVPGTFLALIWAIFVADGPRKSRFVTASEADFIDADEPSPVSLQNATLDGMPRTKFDRLDYFLRARKAPLLQTPREILTSFNFIAITVAYFFIQGTAGFILAWLPTYLVEVKKFSIMNVGFVAASPFVGAVLGNVAGGLISDRLLGGRRKPAMMISAVFTMVSMYLLTSAPNEPLALSILLFGIGFFLSIGLAAFVIYPSRLCDQQRFPLAMGYISTGGQLGAAVVPLTAGLLLDHYGWNAVFIAISAGAGLAFLILTLAIEPLGEPAQS
ncbi:MFS transporter [Sphingobium terrigena]|uniref:MFS transporter n=1 Tax=Sphingobium terrigena TaxID=2304063 RepID=A0A418YXV5_9SPHN|nr:MFS transporter [Sphingobium terrigena]RJG57662.1 MFS transporter [Sphingobium terrigena]